MAFAILIGISFKFMVIIVPIAITIYEMLNKNKKGIISIITTIIIALIMFSIFRGIVIKTVFGLNTSVFIGIMTIVLLILSYILCNLTIKAAQDLYTTGLESRLPTSCFRKQSTVGSIFIYKLFSTTTSSFLLRIIIVTVNAIHKGF
jgi:hypothetical protein